MVRCFHDASPAGALSNASCVRAGTPRDGEDKDWVRSIDLLHRFSTTIGRSTTPACKLVCLFLLFFFGCKVIFVGAPLLSLLVSDDTVRTWRDETARLRQHELQMRMLSAPRADCSAARTRIGTTDDGDAIFEHSCDKEQPQEPPASCAALRLARFDTDRDGSLSYGEASAAAGETLPDLVSRHHQCRLPETRAAECWRHAGSDHAIAAGAEYDAWRACVLRPLTSTCRKSVCDAHAA